MKVLIVDDEMAVRVQMKTILDWSSCGFELIGEAANGREALGIIYENKPEIVITDIKMPIMDGLLLIEKVKEISPLSKFIVLSNYNDFDIVKEAMKSGAEDYILKYKMNPEQLLKILCTTRDNINKIKNKIKEGKQVEYQSHKSNPFIQKRLLNDIIYYDYMSDLDFNNKQSYLKLNIDLSSICCIAVKIYDLNELEKFSEQEMTTLNISIINITEEIIIDSFEGYCIDTKVGEFCIILLINSSINQTKLEEKLRETKNRLSEMLYMYLNIKFLIGIGQVKSGVEGIRSSYREATESLRTEQSDYNVYMSKLIYRAKEYIDKNYDKPLNIQDVADSVKLSRSYFSMLFSEYMNISCNDYITQVRIGHAKELLKYTDHKIYEIAEMVGYNNCHYFSRVFKKVAGESPIEYRTKIQ